MFDPNDEWDRWRTRYGGYTVETLEDFVDQGTATYDEATDSYTIICDHYDHDPAGCSGIFTVTDQFVW